MFSLPLSGVFVTAVFYIANYWKKISIHAAGGGILVGFILAYILIQSEYQLGSDRNRLQLQAGLLNQGFGQAQQARQQDYTNLTTPDRGTSVSRCS